MASPAVALLEDAATYAEKHKIFQLMESLLQEVIVHKPDKPLDHLIKVLKRDAVPKIVVAGPPGAQARSLCELLAAKNSLVHVIASDVWRELAKQQVPAGLKAKAFVDDGKEIPSDLMFELLLDKLSSGDCVSKGWVLEGYPADVGQARKMLAGGILPTRFIHIGVEDAEVVRRLSGRRVDPKENTVYHIEDAPPPNGEVAARLLHRADDTKERVAERLMSYRKAMAGVLPCFSKVLKEISGAAAGEQGVSALLDQAMPLITSEMPSRAPRGCPRVLLMGGPGSNLESLGAALASTYGAKLISAIELLHGAALNGSKGAAKAMKAAQPLTAAGPLVGELVLSRISEEDVRTSGFILIGFPLDKAQATQMRKAGVWLRHVVHLELSTAAAEKAVRGTRYDPWDGNVYHLETNPPADEATAKRLVVHPKHEPAAVKADLKVWMMQKTELAKVYASEMLTEDATRPERELVERLAPCFLSL